MEQGSTSGLMFVNRYWWPDHSATAQLLTDLTITLARRGLDVSVITSRQLLDTPEARLPAAETYEKVRVLRAWTSRFGRGNLAGRFLDYCTFYVSAALAVARTARRGDVLVVMTDPPLLCLALAPVAWIKGLQLVNWWQDVYPEVAVRLGAVREGLLIRCLRALRNRTLRMARMNVVLGTRMAEFLQSEERRAALRTIPNWSEDHRWTPEPEAGNSLRQRYGLKGKVVVGYSGNVGRAHDLQPLLQAAARLPGLPLHFLVIGGGAGYDALQQQCSEAGLANWTFAPYQPRERLAESLGVIDIHIVTLKPGLEGLIVPSKFYGVLAVGRPSVFLGDCDGEFARLPEIRQFARIVAHQDLNALCDSLRELALDRNLRLSLGTRARREFEVRYTVEAAVRAWLELFSELGVVTIGHHYGAEKSAVDAICVSNRRSFHETETNL
jgi:glycosyltransferase involved in cell wall biosynthesis